MRIILFGIGFAPDTRPEGRISLISRDSRVRLPVQNERYFFLEIKNEKIQGNGRRNLPPGKEIPKHYDFTEVEGRWQRTWRDEDNYFDRSSSRPRFIIDTPPPYPTGNFHIGNALNWCYIDFIARYRRMQVFNVMFPQGWDCHGLPTEVKVEE